MVGEINRSPRGALHRKNMHRKTDGAGGKEKISTEKTAGSAGGFDGYTI